MHEATTAGLDSNGHTASGGDGIVISSHIEIIAGGYRQLPEFVDAFMDGAIRLGHRARGSREANCPVRRPALHVIQHTDRNLLWWRTPGIRCTARKFAFT